MDNLTRKQRSYNMSRIKSTGTKLEEKFFKLLDDNNISYTKYPKIYGKPDCQIGKNLLIFIDSDFWHGWRFSLWRDRLPKKYWADKIAGNIKRDSVKFLKLRKQGCKVVRIWEHNLKHPAKVVLKLRGVSSDLPI